MRSQNILKEHQLKNSTCWPSELYRNWNTSGVHGAGIFWARSWRDFRISVIVMAGERTFLGRKPMNKKEWRRLLGMHWKVVSMAMNTSVYLEGTFLKAGTSPSQTMSSKAVAYCFNWACAKSLFFEGRVVWNEPEAILGPTLVIRLGDHAG